AGEDHARLGDHRIFWRRWPGRTGEVVVVDTIGDIEDTLLAALRNGIVEPPCRGHHEVDVSKQALDAREHRGWVRFGEAPGVVRHAVEVRSRSYAVEQVGEDQLVDKQHVRRSESLALELTHKVQNRHDQRPPRDELALEQRFAEYR